MTLYVSDLSRSGRLLYYVMRTLVRLGFLQAPEGGLFSKAKWSLRVWENTAYLRIVDLPPSATLEWRFYQHWYRFWLWLAADWQARMPSTFTECDRARERELAELREAVALANEYLRVKIKEISAMVDHALIYGTSFVPWDRGKPIARSLTAEMVIDAARTLQS